MGIQVLGPLAVDGSGRLGPRDRAVLQALTVRQGGPVTADELGDAVWGAHPPASAHKNLQSCIVRLRKTLGPGTIETTDRGYRLAVPADEVDARRFEAQVVRARDLLELGEADRVVYLLEQALDLWRGAAFADLSEWPPARREASRLDELRREAEELLIDAQLRLGRTREALPRAHDMVRAAPLRERRWELLALAQYRTGAQGEALRTIRQLRAVLARELGIDPAPAVLALEQSVLQQDPSLGGSAEGPRSATCPWQGLQAYDVAEADRFFGRDAEIEAGSTILAEGRLLALVGPSGSGKSSLMRAGIGARLQERGTRCTILTPGRYPVRALSSLTALQAGDALLVDQAEELFTLCEDPEESATFIARLVEEAACRPVVVALRADRLADLTAYPAFSRLVERGLYLVGGLDEAGLRLAVVEPARQAGLLLEPGLVDVLVTEVRDDPGALPLLSHALLETWKRREGNTLTVDGYRASGGIHGAVAQSAERLYAEVEPDHREALRDLVLRLLSPGSEGEPVRTRVPRRLVATGPEHVRLIEMLVAARLVTSDDGVLEVTHESLARAWPRLRGWLEDDVEGRRILHHLSSTADAWDTLGRPDSELYRGGRLTRTIDWAAGAGVTLTVVEQDFLEAARAQAEVEERSAAEQARMQARMIRRLRIVLGGAVALLVLALAAGGVAVVQSERANDTAARAQQLAVSADARRVGLRSQLTDDISLSLLLAVAGTRLDVSPETRTNLLTALAEQPLLVRSVPPGGGYLDVFDVSHDGRWIAASDDQNRMHVYDAATNQLHDSYDAGRTGSRLQALGAAFSPDSKQLAVVLHGTKSTEPIRILDPTTMDPATELTFPDDEPVWAVDARFSADGTHLATTVQTVNWPYKGHGRSPSHALVWDLRSPSSLPVRVSTGTDVQGMALSPDGDTLYTGWPLTAYDVATGTRVWRRPDLTTWYTALDLNSEGTLLAVSDWGDEMSARDGILVDPVTGETVHTLRGHRSTVNDIRFSPDGTLLGSVANDGELIVWDTTAGRPLERWDTSDPYSVGFGPDNDLVHGGGLDSMLRTWDRSAQGTYLRRTTQVDDAGKFAWAHVSPDGDQVAYRWVDGVGRGWVRFVDTDTGRRTPATRLPAWEGSPWVPGAWHPDGTRYAAHWCDGVPECMLEPGSVRILESATGKLIEQEDVLGGDRDIFGIAYVDDGRSLILTEGLAHFDDLHTSIVDAGTLLSPDRLDIASNCCATAIGRDGTAMVYEAARDLGSGHVRMLNVSTGEVLAEGEVDLLAYTSTASPDATTVAVAGKTGEIVTLDVSTGDEQGRATSLGSAVHWLDYSEDGERLVSGAADGGVSLWDASTLELLGTVHPPRLGKPVISGTSFIGDTHDVAIASYDGTVYRWDTDLDRAIDFACQMAGRDLTEAEWAQFLPAQPYRSVCPQD
ncbi:BTAD domain-containing putative transcriptional regulator [Nocardioides sp. S5]|uniref:nSTAND1 domain-containing NTPase n=1 Tax=Nocardioides sp. S5 TaxID=2017486 RepID=UPI001A8EE4BB|nr:BTAD domain-containing putative transcriptional regulator [Nocardioides sp. S5]